MWPGCGLGDVWTQAGCNLDDVWMRPGCGLDAAWMRSGCSLDAVRTIKVCSNLFQVTLVWFRTFKAISGRTDGMAVISTTTSAKST